ncbi:multicopper oxidase domain-containing protein [Roseibacillus ishigakijimensis]|uniref:Multicopper oxidase domain-containing protein n=1 Tax=Roseibacillus ishigakijimensis TaxID=454146 RepID=A0A934VM35_9BACT|nr:multicopper oxidase domain-containing protein [Roseibacillus ishigakijimensis]MBK1833540.1 multicopper oxidase domain-containing protein [Roseibacillus ishigakijimensis]
MKILTFLFLFTAPLWGKIVNYELTVSEKTLSPAGKARRALTLNGGIPGPTLRFREGDTARIRVHNGLADEETSIHWHGLLVPNEMDGVPYLTTPPIPPGEGHLFEFELTHAGTYWYHSHTGLQEQRGVYGSLVVTPQGGEPVAADRDYVVVLSDWTNEKPQEVMRTLMRGSEYYAIRKGNAQSLLGAWQAGAWGDYWQRERSRMAPMDISDVYYDAFLINGQQRSRLPAPPGETVRLRLINAGASTYFYAHSATGPLTIVAADGPAVQPVRVEKLLMGMAETYDVLVTIPESGSWEFRATAQDNSGHASLFLGEGPEHLARDLPDPNLYSMDHMLEAAMGSMGEGMAMAGMEGQEQDRPQAPYGRLQARRSTTLPASAPVREIELRLTGDMTRYIWSFNGKTLAEESTIPVRQGEVLRISLVNDTMMHHPLHLHGHFFRLLNGQGARSPLKHTVDVPPMGRQTIEFLANEEGDWFFHCHLLYHMDAGMARVFSYEKARNPAHQPQLDPKLINPTFWLLDGMLLSHHTMGDARVMWGREDFGLMWDYGFHDHREYELDAYWMHYFDPNLSTMLGYRFTNSHEAEDRFFAQANYRLPFLIESTLALDSQGDVRVGLEKEVPLTDRLSLFGEVEYDTNTRWEWSAGASYLLNKQFSLTGTYHSEHGLGAGVSFRF